MKYRTYFKSYPLHYNWEINVSVNIMLDYEICQDGTFQKLQPYCGSANHNKGTLWNQNVRELLIAESITIRRHDLNTTWENNSWQYHNNIKNAYKYQLVSICVQVANCILFGQLLVAANDHRQRLRYPGLVNISITIRISLENHFCFDLFHLIFLPVFFYRRM